jgi:hypothetical protein
MSTVPSLLWTAMTTVTTGSPPRHDRTGRGLGPPTPDRRSDGRFDNAGFGETVRGQDAGNADAPTPDHYAGVMPAAS